MRYASVGMGVIGRRLLFLSTLVLALGGCKIVLEPEEGGSIRSENGRRTCAGPTCTIDIWWDGGYSETFYAIPNRGYEFAGWKKGPGLLCGGSTEPCVLQNIPAEFTRLNITMRLVAQFRDLGDAPLTVNVQSLRKPLSIYTGLGVYVIEKKGTYSLGSIPVGSLYNLDIGYDGDNQACRFDKPYGKVTSDSEIVVQLSCSKYKPRPSFDGYFYADVQVGESTEWGFQAFDADTSFLSVNYELLDGPEGGDLDFQVLAGGNTLALSGSVPGLYTIMVSLSDGTSQVTEDLKVRVLNEEPVVGLVRLEPATTADPIVAGFEDGPPTDPEGFDVSVRYEWQVNRRPLAGYSGSTLPTGVAKRDDWVQVFVTVSDGGNDVLVKSNIIRVADSPVQVKIAELPASVTQQGFADVPVSASDFDGPPQLELAYRPVGMRLENGRLSWAPDLEMFEASQTVRFGVRNADNHDIVEHFSVQLTDEARQPLLAKSGLYTPRSATAFSVGQFDDDAAVEVLLSDRATRFMTVEYRDGEYFQDWLHPFLLSPEFVVKEAFGVDIDDDGVLEVIAWSEQQLYVINGRDTRARLLYEVAEGESITSASAADLANDSGPELVLMVGNSLRIIDGESGQLAREIPVKPRSIFGPNAAVLGNIDGDAGLEAVVRSGAAYDLQTGQLDWEVERPFYQMNLVDVNGDGISELFAMDEGKPTLYSGLDGSILWELERPFPSACDLAAGELDDQPGDELLVMQCDGLDVNLIAYAATHTGMSELWREEAPGRGKTGTTVADIDGDGQQEIVWATEVSISFPNQIAVAELVGDGIEITRNDATLAWGTAYAAGAFTNTEGEERAVFHSSGSTRGHRMLFIDEAGEISLGESFGENYSRYYASALADYDSDGRPELIVGSSENSEGKLVALDVDTRVVEASYEWNHERESVLSIDLHDFNGDGREDIYALLKHDPLGLSTVYSFSVVDLYNGVQLGRGRFLEDLIAMAIVDLDGDKVPEIVTSSKTELRSWRWNMQEGIFERFSAGTQDFACTDFEVGDIAGDGREELVCHVYDQFANSSLTEFETVLHVLDNQLQPMWTLSLPYAITTMSLDDRESPVRNLYLGARADRACTHRFECSAGVSLNLISLEKGHPVLESPPLLGGDGVQGLYGTKGPDGRRRLIFATDRAMYQTR